ncbi:MAG: hypothetical protein MJZ61_01665 [Bacteroidales bacterium]|nr:hypothetical protein [Bacteroidales bacterium]
MKKWIIIIVVILLALLVIGILHDAGYLNFKWQTLTTIFAALAGPYTYLKNKLFKNNNVDSVQELINKAKNGLQEDEEHRQEFDTKISDKESEINRLNNQVTVLDKKLKELEVQAANNHTVVKEMSSDEIARAFETLYGNEKDE